MSILTLNALLAAVFILGTLTAWALILLNLHERRQLRLRAIEQNRLSSSLAHHLRLNRRKA